MNKYRFALQFSIVAILTLSLTACPSGGGFPAQSNDSAAPPTGSAPPPGSPPPPTESGPAITITSPGADRIDTTDDHMAIEGVASSDDGVSSVAWQTDQGAKGGADGTESWSIDAVPLEMGTTTVTVTATDAAGETSTDVIAINREGSETGAVTLAWVAPTQRTDGSPLTNLAGYTIRYGRMSGIYDYTVKVENPGTTTYVVENLVPGDWYFTLKAHDADGLESDLSNEAHRHID